jgi:hypothetical protein
MKVMAFIYPDRSIELGPEARARIPGAVEAWVNEMDARGVRLQGHVLADVAGAKTVRVRNGELQVADGPVGDRNAPITGFNILECADLDEAIEIASSHPVATFGALELRVVAG